MLKRKQTETIINTKDDKSPDYFVIPISWLYSMENFVPIKNLISDPEKVTSSNTVNIKQGSNAWHLWRKDEVPKIITEKRRVIINGSDIGHFTGMFLKEALVMFSKGSDKKTYQKSIGFLQKLPKEDAFRNWLMTGEGEKLYKELLVIS